MGHIRLPQLPQTRKWQAVIELIDGGASSREIAAAASDASNQALSQAGRDPLFLIIVGLLTDLPQEARGPGYAGYMAKRGIKDIETVPGLISGLADWIDSESFRIGHRTDIAEMGQSAFLAALYEELQGSTSSLFGTSASDIRRALGKLASGNRFSHLARRFFANFVYRTLDYYVGRELSNHVGLDRRFESDADRVAFDQALAVHAFEAARIVEAYSGGWYGKAVWRRGGITKKDIGGFTAYAMTKLRQELAQRDDAG